MRRRKIVTALLVFVMAVTAMTCFIVIPASASEETAVVKSGSTGATVKKIQQLLKNQGFYTGAVDGIYGSKTVAAVKAYQKRFGLTVDGIVGAKTAAYMGISLSDNSSSSGYSSSDLYLLARLVNGEARGEPYTGQVAVAAVVLNRVKSASFPNTVSGVIYQSNAFTSVSDGQINLAPSESAKKAAQDAMNGWDPTGGCLYFYNPATSTSKWIWSRTVVVKIGKHNFAL